MNKVLKLVFIALKTGEVVEIVAKDDKKKRRKRKTKAKGSVVAKKRRSAKSFRRIQEKNAATNVDTNPRPYVEVVNTKERTTENVRYCNI